MSDKSRAEAHGALASPPRRFDVGTLRFDLKERLYVPGRGLWVELTSPTAKVDPDGYFWPNPPVKHNGVENLTEAFRFIVTEAARHYHSRPEVWGRTTATFYADTTDGHVLSFNNTYSSAASGSGLDLNSFGASVLVTGQVFDTPTYECYESFVQFDTSSLPDADNITSAVISLDGDTDSSTTNFTAEVSIYDWGADLATTDWRTPAQLGALTRVATWASSGYVAGYNDFTSDAAFVSNVNKTGATRLIVSSDRHRAQTTPTNFERVHFTAADAAGTTSDPRLVVNHGTDAKRNVARRSSQAVQRAATI